MGCSATIAALAGCGGAGVAPREGTAAPSYDCARSSGERGPQHLDPTRSGSSILAARFGDRHVAYVADEDAQAIHAVDIDGRKLLYTKKLDGAPSQLALTADGRLVVALRDLSQLRLFDAGDEADDGLSELCTVPTPAEPVGLALSPKGDMLIVTSGWSHSVMGLSVDGMKRRFVVTDLPREPRGVVVSEDGKSAFITHMVGGWVSEIDLERGALRDRLSLDAPQPTNRGTSEQPKSLAESVHYRLARQRRKLDDGSLASSQAFAITRSRELPGRLWVPQVVVNPGGRAIRTVGYGNGGATQLASIAVVDAPRAEIVDSSLNPSQLSLASIGFGNSFGSSFGGSFGNVVVQDQQPCRLPRAATIDPKSKSLLVACLGIHSVVAFDAASVRPAVTEKRRWRVPAGPTGIAVEPKGRRALVWSQFDRSVSFIPLDGPELVNEQQELNDAVVSIKMPSEEPQDIAIAMGRLLFHASGDSRISQDGRACASCHPDGRDDSLTWSTPNGPRRTLTLAGRLGGTEPYAWDGTSRDLHHHLGTTFKRLGGTGLTNVERDALVAYLRTLEAPPPLPPSAPSDAIALGERLFRSEEAACASCHEGNLLTDNAKHDVESRAEADAAPSFNTPSLKHVSQRAPYFHDGRYATLQQLLVGSDGTMGHSQHLSPREVASLVAYMESL